MLNSLMSFFKGTEEVPQVDTHWMSESGIIDVFVMLGPKPHDVFSEYASFTGTTALPPVSLVQTVLFYPLLIFVGGVIVALLMVSAMDSG